MLFVRSLLFNLAFYAWSTGWSLLLFPFLFLPRHIAAFVQRNWSRGVTPMLDILAGIEVDIRHADRFLPAPVIVACKHQSAWETTVFQGLLHNPAIVMKRELQWIPLFGWYSAKMRMIAVNRAQGTQAMRDLIRKAKAARDESRSIVIFPEGTRVDARAESAYQAGVYALYKNLNVPVVPVALNSGYFWARRSFYRYPGRLIMEALPPLEPGLERAEFMTRLKSSIEEASERLDPARQEQGQ